MYIDKLEIRNFRGLDLAVENISKKVLIIGKNDVGKTNLCNAIRKVLDFESRRNILHDVDSTDCNKKDIEIKIRINLNGISTANLSKIARYMDREDGNNYLYVSFKAIFNDGMYLYDEELIFGNADKKTINIYKPNELDSLIQIVYVNPLYNIDKSQLDYFKYCQKKQISDKEKINNNIKTKIDELNNAISIDENIKKIVDTLNSTLKNEDFFADTEFNISSNFNFNYTYNSLNINPKSLLSGNNANFGDGKNKVLSMMLQQLSTDNEKERIFIVEEPENHLYPYLQQKYVSMIDSMCMSQTIITSHSPYLADFKKLDQIIKLKKDFIENKYKTNVCQAKIDLTTYQNFGFLLNDEIAKMFYNDEVLLVEGFSEKYFYNILFNKDEKFRNLLISRNMGIFCVGGIDFAPARILLESLGIKVYIKTDNDVYGLDDATNQYAGIKRVFGCLNEDSLNKLSFIIHNEEGKTITKENFNFDKSLEYLDNIEEKMDEICELFFQNNILLSNHHSGFEGDFLLFIGSTDMQKDMKYLQSSKLKNLHSYVYDNIEKIKINDLNENNILVGFLKNEH